ncbi:GLUG motif-containing protein [Wukongibacter sp. M2B1]|uniref:GLUG motif-containing protein n=1 Tax=Wukongibacter sp. M2B1 TaxID=3088895 RepID=UPI003D7B59A6
MQGNGTTNDPYIITTRSELEGIKDNLEAHYKLGNDIDLENEEWEPIGNASAQFIGSLDGNGYTIENLKITRVTTYGVGLFSHIQDTTIKNLTIKNADVEGNSYTGALIGNASNNFNIDNCKVEGIGKVKGVSNVGGLIGQAASSGTGEINNCSAKIKVEGISNGVGGLVGNIYNGQIRKCYATGDVESTGYMVGGLVGYAYVNTENSTIEESYAVGNVEGRKEVGGLIGKGYCNKASKRITVENCFALGDINSTDGTYGYIGGLIGYLYGHSSSRNIVRNSYSTGKVSSISNNNEGGLIGYLHYGDIIDSYYDGVASEYEPKKQIDFSKLTTAMKRQDTFVNWDFSTIWGIEEGNSYPYIKDIPRPDEVIQGLPENEVSGGNGELANPYIIETKEQLNNIRYDVAGHYKLGNDIDLENEEWEPIGNASAQFIGSLDGNGYTIENLKITRVTTYGVGLFSHIQDTTIKNLTIKNADVEGNSYTGALIGNASNNFNIDNCKVEGIGKVKGVSNVGGLIGQAASSGTGEINNCSAKIKVEGISNGVGGLVGNIYNGQIRKCYATGDVESTGYMVGGLVGYAYVNTENSTIEESYAVGNVEGRKEVGGLIGKGYCNKASKRITVENCFALGDINSTDGTYGYIGGLIGYLYGHSSSRNIVRNSYSAGKVSSISNNNVGGLIGYLSYGDIIDSYYDGVASEYEPKKQIDFSKLTTAMKRQDTFVNWDFSTIWGIEEGNSYPYIKDIPRPDEVIQGLPENEVSGGNGELANPYIIETKEQLNNIRYDVAGHYKLGNDIDLENEEWEPIGNASAQFIGSLDGNGYTIENLKITRVTTYGVGLFSHIQDTTIKNLTIKNADVEGNSYTGALIGNASNNFNIDNCKVEGIGKVKGVSNVGGLIGQAASSGTGEINNCSAKIKVEGISNGVGGLVGNIYNGQVRKCYATGDVESTGYMVGGLVGYAYVNTENSTIEESYAVGNVEGRKEVGGLIGKGYCNKASKRITVENCFALGDINSTDGTYGYIGGLIGYLYGHSSSRNIVRNSYSAGKVSSISNNNEGGLIGYPFYVDIIDSYYDSTNTGFTTPEEQARTSEQLMQQNTFSNWNFTNIWDINNGSSYPYLRNVKIPKDDNMPDMLERVKNINTTITYNSIAISWEEIGEATGYEIEIDGVVIDNGSSSAYTHQGLEPGTEHEYRVRAKNDSKFGQWSNLITVSTLVVTLDIPNNISTVEDITQISLTWDSVNGASSYEIEVDGNVIDNGNSINYIHINLESATDHTYRIRAKNDYVESEWSDPITVSTFMHTPEGVNISVEGTTITLSWDPVTGATGYDIEADGLVVNNGTINSYVHSDLESSTEHSYRVRAKKEDKISAWSDIVTGDIAKKGTTNNPYIITTREELKNTKDDLSAYYKLGKDIDLENEEWEPIGDEAIWFTGTLDGDGYSIKNLKINREERDYVGLFGYIRGATIKNLKIENADINGKNKVGALLGEAQVNFTIENCSVIGTGRVKGNEDVGGLIGSSTHPFNSYRDGNIRDSSSRVNVEGVSNVGGLVGIIEEAKISRCYATGDVTGIETKVGGLIGYAIIGKLKDGRIGDHIEESYAVGRVEGKREVGGLIGCSHNSIIHEENYGTIVKVLRDCFALGEITATDESTAYAGGLVGAVTGGSSKCENMLINSYSVGRVNSSTENMIGGLLGSGGNSYYHGILSCRYDGIVSKHIPRKAYYEISRLTSAMRAEVTYTNWDFENLWEIDEGKSYPYLKNLPRPVEVENGPEEKEVAEGIGTIEEPYIIETKEQLNNIRYDLSSHYRLRKDIDLQNEEWEPIGDEAIWFTGTLDGDGYSIKNLKINREERDYVGLFGYIRGATIKNLKIENADINGKNKVGALLGEAQVNFTIESCSVIGTGRVKGNEDVGGLIGSSTHPFNSYRDGNIRDSSSRVNVEGVSNVGGLVGIIEEAKISRCYATGDVTGIETKVGGLIGYAIIGKLKDGRIGDHIEESYAVGRVEGKREVGGLIGCSHNSIIHEENYGTIVKVLRDCFALGEITATDESIAYAGGLVGAVTGGSSKCENMLINSYSAGRVNSSTENMIGGLLGSGGNSYYHGILSCRYDGIVSKHIPRKAYYEISRLTSAMRAEVTYTNWDFENLWEIDEGKSYPYLKNLPRPVEVENGPEEKEVAEGIGTIEEPYIIETKEQLNNIRYDLSSHYRLRKDIDLENEEWEPIGDEAIWFTGTLDGDGYSIKNLKINREERDYVGLFGCIGRKGIRNVKIENVDIKGRNKVGALTGYARGDFDIESCSVIGTGRVKGNEDVGGLIGSSTHPFNSYRDGNIRDSSSRVNVEGVSNVGGLVGIIEEAKISRCYATGDVTGIETKVGGLIGYAIIGKLKDGRIGDHIEESYAVGRVEGKREVGGLIGCSHNSIIHEENYGTIVKVLRDCFALGEITATDESTAYAGGLVGAVTGGSSKCKNTIKNSYSAGIINKATENAAGGLVGYIGHTNITSCYYNSANAGSTTPVEQARTEEELEKQTTFINWDFIDIWDIDEGLSYPYLRSLPVPEYTNMLKHLMPVKMRVIRKTDTEIVLRWDEVPEAESYELMVDGVIIDNGLERTYTHENLISGSTHEYRIRAKNSEAVSSWSPRLFVTTLIGTPQNVRATVIDDTIEVTWDAVQAATKYIVEVNGDQTYTVDTPRYIQNNIEENKVYYYRVRAIDGEKTSQWSEVASVTSWPKDKPAISLVADNWKSYIDENDELEIIVKAHGFKDFYTMQLYLEYDPKRVILDMDKTKGLINIDEKNRYFRKLNDKVLKTLLSATGDIKGKEGEFDVASIKIQLDAYRETPIKVDTIKIVDSMANYIDIAEVSSLEIKQLDKIKY